MKAHTINVSFQTQSLSHVRLFEILWAVACQASLFMEFSRQEYWKGLPFSPPGDLPDPGIKPTSPVSPALADRFFTTSTTRKAPEKENKQIKMTVSMVEC